MDIDDWELLPVPSDTHTSFDFGLESGKDSFFSKETNLSPDAIVDNHYFIIPSPSLQEKNLRPEKDETEEDSATRFKDIVPPPQAIFKKLKDDQFVDMNVESPKFSSKGTIEPELILFEDKREEFYEDDKYPAIEKEGMDEEEDCANRDIKDQPCWEGFGVKAWKWKLVVGGVRALCSIGVAAATIGIMVLAGHQQQNSDPHSQRLQFQIYTDKTRMKQVVQQATKMNPVLTEVEGGPMTRAHVSFGGYYDGF